MIAPAPQPGSDNALTVRDLGRMPYAAAFDIQRATHAAVAADQAPPTLLLVEHDPVITVSRRKSSPAHLLASAQRLEQLGIDVQPTDRGGDVTYHGPGQVVAYPILPLPRFGLDLGSYLRLLEQVVIELVQPYGIQARRDPDATGVWVDRSPAPAKLCAIGVRIGRRVTMHGLALNVTTDLSHFATIVPCGLADRGVTSLAELLGADCPAFETVKRELAGSLASALGLAPGAAT